MLANGKICVGAIQSLLCWMGDKTERQIRLLWWVVTRGSCWCRQHKTDTWWGDAGPRTDVCQLCGRWRVWTPMEMATLRPCESQMGKGGVSGWGNSRLAWSQQTLTDFLLLVSSDSVRHEAPMIAAELWTLPDLEAGALGALTARAKTQPLWVLTFSEPLALSRSLVLLPSRSPLAAFCIFHLINAIALTFTGKKYLLWQTWNLKINQWF